MTLSRRLALSSVRFGFGRNLIVNDLSLILDSGEIIALLGPNGSGKSTVLNLIAGMLHPQQGSIYYGEFPLHSIRPHRASRLGIAYLMQGGVVFPNLTVEQNLAFAQSRGSSARLHPLPETLRKSYPLASLLKRRAGLLSGGERQTLAISMVVAQNPRVLLLDEPVAGLSEELSTATAELITSMCKQSGCSAIIAEHNLTFASSINATCYQLGTNDGVPSAVRVSQPRGDLAR